MARGTLPLLSRRFGTPRAAALVLVILTGLAAFCIAAGPSAFISLTRIEAGYQVGSVHHAARDLGGSSQESWGSWLGPPAATPDPRLTSGAVPGFGAIYDDLAANHAAWPESARAIIEPGSIALQSDNYRANRADVGMTDLLTEIRFTIDPEWENRVRLVEGQWPVPVDPERVDTVGPDWMPDPEDWLGQITTWRTHIQIALVKSVAERVSWSVGETRSVQLIRGITDEFNIPPAHVTLVGVVELNDPDDLAWWELPRVNPTEMLSDNRTIVMAAFVAPEIISQDHPGAMFGFENLYVWYPVTGDPVPSLDTEQLLADFDQVLANPIDLRGVKIQLSSATAAALADSLARVDSTAAVLGIAVSGPVAVSLALIAVASGLVLRRRASADRLLSGRGLSLGRQRLLLALEGLLLGLPVVIVAVVVARLVTVEDAGWVPDAIAIAVGFTPALALLTTAADPLARTSRATDLGAPPRGRAWIRLTAEIIVWMLALGAAALMITRGDSQGAHPLVVLAPVLVAAAVGLLAVRLYPVAVRGVLAASRRWKGPIGLVGAVRTLRDPIVGGVAVLAVIVVVATVAFSATMLTTMQRGADAAGAQAAGGDLRVTGPSFNANLVVAVDQVPGVAAVATIANVNAVELRGVETRNISLVVLDPETVAKVQAGLPGGLDAKRATSLESELEVGILLGTELAAKVEGESLTIKSVPVTATGEVSSVLGMTLAGDWAVISVAGFERIFGSSPVARNLLIRLDDEIRATGNAAAPQAHGGTDVANVMADVVAVVNNSHSMTNYWQHRARIAGSPAVISLQTSLLVALGLSVLLAAVAIMLLAGVTRENRARTAALLSTLGVDRRQQTGIVAWEFVPIVAAGLVAGGVLGALIPWLAVTGVNLRPFTAGRAQPALSVEPFLLASMGVVALAAIGFVVALEVWRARSVPVVDVLRSEEHG